MFIISALSKSKARTFYVNKRFPISFTGFVHVSAITISQIHSCVFITSISSIATEKKSSDALSAVSDHVPELFGVMAVPTVIVIHPEGMLSVTLFVSIPSNSAWELENKADKDDDEGL